MRGQNLRSSRWNGGIGFIQRCTSAGGVIDKLRGTDRRHTDLIPGEQIGRSTVFHDWRNWIHFLQKGGGITGGLGKVDPTFDDTTVANFDLLGAFQFPPITLADCSALEMVAGGPSRAQVQPFVPMLYVTQGVDGVESQPQTAGRRTTRHVMHEAIISGARRSHVGGVYGSR